jgi:hypothetical protein
MVFWMLGDRGPGLNLGGRLLLTTPRRAGTASRSSLGRYFQQWKGHKRRTGRKLVRYSVRARDALVNCIKPQTIILHIDAYRQ